MAHHAHVTEVSNPGSFRVSPTTKTLFAVFTLVGLVAWVAGLKMAPTRAWPNFLINYFFFFALALSGAFFTALQHVSNAYWSVTVRRLAEGLMSYLPIALVLGVVLFLGRHSLYEWTHTEEVAHDAILKLKSNYMNSGMFGLRLFGFLGLLVLLGFAMRRNSLRQDVTGDEKLTLSNIKLSTAFLPVFGFGFSLIAVDILMSLEPHWFSTMYGVYCFAGLFYSGLALLAILVISARRQKLFNDKIANMNHLHDIGKLMFAFTVFWAYIMFSQLMLQWYANLPEETPYYIRRFHGGWWPYFWALFTAHFVIPFFGLLPRGLKRNEGYLKKMAYFMLFAQWMDVYFLVMPVFFPEGPVFGWIEIGTFLGFLGLFGLSVTHFLGKVPAIPVKDPRLAQCLAHTQ